MARVIKSTTGAYLFMCPGCQEYHSFAVDKPFDNGAQWSFNGDVDQPTFNPSLLVKISSGKICHSFVREGRIEYCHDTTHELSGHTVELPEIEL